MLQRPRQARSTRVNRERASSQGQDASLAKRKVAFFWTDQCRLSADEPQLI